MGKWNSLIIDYYRTGDMTKLKSWTYNNGIQGVESRRKKQILKKDLH